MSSFSAPHATIFVAPSAAHVIEAVRRAWDADSARQIAAHVTLVYPEEAPDVDLLAKRLRAAAEHVAPFMLRVSGSPILNPADGGVYLGVEDIEGGYERVRQLVLQPPLQMLSFRPHVTLIHPRTSQRGPEFARHGWSYGVVAFTPQRIAITAFEGDAFTTVMSFALRRR